VFRSPCFLFSQNIFQYLAKNLSKDEVARANEQIKKRPGAAVVLARMAEGAVSSDVLLAILTKVSTSLPVSLCLLVC
jgi:hypothetical protein